MRARSPHKGARSNRAQKSKRPRAKRPTHSTAELAEKSDQSFAIHRLPDCPEPQRGSCEDQGCAPHHSGVESPVKPPAGKSAQQNRYDHGPAEPAHHRKRPPERPFAGPQPVLASALRALDGFFQLLLLALALAIVGFFSVHHARVQRLLLRLRLDRAVQGPQIAIDLTNP